MRRAFSGPFPDVTMLRTCLEFSISGDRFIVQEVGVMCPAKVPIGAITGPHAAAGRTPRTRPNGEIDVSGSLGAGHMGYMIAGAFRPMHRRTMSSLAFTPRNTTQHTCRDEVNETSTYWRYFLSPSKVCAETVNE